MSQSLNFDDSRVEFAIAAVSESAQLAREIQKHRRDLALSKEDRSPVTVADFSVQALIAHRLAGRFPDEPLVAEEDTQQLVGEPRILDEVVRWVGTVAGAADRGRLREWIDRGTSDPASRFWTLDPIDGTQGFLRGEQYAVAFAYLEEGEVQLCVLGCPNLSPDGTPDIGGKGSLIVAVKGQGCRASVLGGNEFRPLHVSTQREIRRARVLRSVVAAHTNVSQFDRLIETLGVEVPPVCLDSQAKYGALASGRGDLMLRLLSPARPGYREKIWDQAAGSLAVQEAGGRVTDLTGRPLDFSHGRRLEQNEGILASNGLLHDLVLEALNRPAAS